MDEIPDFKPSSVDERIKNAAEAGNPGPRGITDWDFGDVTWELDDVTYHTAPPSLTGSGVNVALVKHATTGALSDGRLVAWFRSASSSYINYIIFRNQKADGGADEEDTYSMNIYAGTTGLRLIRIVGGSGTAVDTKTYTWDWAINTWYKVRVTWWTAAERLFVRVERWNGEAWVTFGGDADDDFEDATNQWKDSAVNRCGITYYRYMWIDDLEVWG